MKLRLLIAGGLVATFLTLGVVIAHASIPAANGVIHGCYKATNPGQGVVVVIDTDLGQTCPSGTISLDWNQVGPQGPAGPQGPPGVAPVVTYPSWWGTASAVQLDTISPATSYSSAPPDMVLLPQGVSMVSGNVSILVPWSNVSDIHKLS